MSYFQKSTKQPKRQANLCPSNIYKLLTCSHADVSSSPSHPLHKFVGPLLCSHQHSLCVPCPNQYNYTMNAKRKSHELCLENDGNNAVNTMEEHKVETKGQWKTTKTLQQPIPQSRQSGAQTTSAHLHWCEADPPSSMPTHFSSMPTHVAGHKGHLRREREKFIIRQPPIGEKDDCDSKNSWISDGLPSSSRRRRRGEGRGKG